MTLIFQQLIFTKKKILFARRMLRWRPFSVECAYIFRNIHILRVSTYLSAELGTRTGSLLCKSAPTQGEYFSIQMNRAESTWWLCTANACSSVIFHANCACAALYLCLRNSHLGSVRFCIEANRCACPALLVTYIPHLMSTSSMADINMWANFVSNIYTQYDWNYS